MFPLSQIQTTCYSSQSVSLPSIKLNYLALDLALVATVVLVSSLILSGVIPCQERLLPNLAWLGQGAAVGLLVLDSLLLTIKREKKSGSLTEMITPHSSLASQPLPEIIKALKTAPTNSIPQLTEGAQKKLEVTNRAFTIFKEKKGVKESVAAEVTHFFQKTLKKIKNNKEAPLPLWFHATKNVKEVECEDNKSKKNIISPFKIITEGGKLKTAPSMQGDGVYLSTQVEWYYGPIAFALDEEAFSDKQADYWQPSSGKIFAVVKEEIELSSKTTAYLIAQPHVFDNAKRLLEEKNSQFILISLKAHELIKNSFEKAFSENGKWRRTLPAQWRARGSIASFPAAFKTTSS